MAASRAVRTSLDWSARSLSARLWWPSSVEPRGMILQATCGGEEDEVSGDDGDDDYDKGGREGWGATNLFAAVFLAGKLHLAHAAGANGLAQDPFAGLGRDSGAGPGLLGGGGGVVRRIGGAVGGGRRGGRGAAIVGDGRGRHVGVVTGAGAVVLMVGAGA